MRRVLVTEFRTLLAATLLLLFWNIAAVAQEPAFKVLAFYSTDVEPDHVHTANDALAFYRTLAAKNNFTFDSTTDWTKLNETDLKPYGLILWLNNFPQTPRAKSRVREVHGTWRRLDRLSRRWLQR